MSWHRYFDIIPNFHLIRPNFRMSLLLQAFLFLSIVLCIEVILRASSFMYNRARKHTTQLREAIQKTKMMMKRIRGGNFPEKLNDDEEEWESKAFESKVKNSRSDNESEPPKQTSVNYQSQGLNDKKTPEKTLKFSAVMTDSQQKKISRRKIAEMKEEDLQIEWERHEAEVHKYLEEREKINDQSSVLVSADANSSRMSFEQFWRESCKFWADIAILFFYAGTANLLLAIMIYMWAEFFITYESPVGAVIAVVFIGVSLVLGILLAIYLRQNDTYGRGQLVRSRPSNSEEGVHNEKESARNSKTSERELKSKGKGKRQSYQTNNSIGRDENEREFSGSSQ